MHCFIQDLVRKQQSFTGILQSEYSVKLLALHLTDLVIYTLFSGVFVNPVCINRDLLVHDPPFYQHSMASQILNNFKKLSVLESLH